MSRVQNGVLSNQPGGGYDTLSDITSILRPELQADNVPGTKTAVQRSSSSPSIGDIPAVGAAAKQTGVGVFFRREMFDATKSNQTRIWL